MKEEKDFNAGFFVVSVRSGYAAPITSGGASRRGTAVTFGWRKSSKVALGKETESLADFHRADHGFQAGRAQDLWFYTCLFK